MADNQSSALSKVVNGGLRSIAASFPVLASLGQAWSEYESHRTGERIYELMDNLKHKYDELCKKYNDIEERCQRISEEFPSLLEIAIEKVQKEFSQEKRQIYADVLANLSIQHCNEPYEDKVSVLHSLDTLNPQDLQVLKLFARKPESAAKDLKWQSLDLHGDDDQKLSELASMLAKLESRGLIVTVRLHSGVIYVPNGLDQSVARLSETQYRILPLGQRLLVVLD